MWDAVAGVCYGGKQAEAGAAVAASQRLQQQLQDSAANIAHCYKQTQAADATGAERMQVSPA